MRCVIHPRHGGLGQLGDKEGLPIVRTCHTHTHMPDRKQTPPQQNPICCKICQRKVKMSVNWGYFIHLSLTASHLLSSLCQLWWGFILHPPCRCHQKSKWGTGSWNYFLLNLLLFWHRFLYHTKLKIKQLLIIHIWVSMHLNLGMRLWPSLNDQR